MLEEPTRAEVMTASKVIQFLKQDHIALTSDWPYLNHVCRLLAEHALNLEGEK